MPVSAFGLFNHRGLFTQACLLLLLLANAPAHAATKDLTCRLTEQLTASFANRTESLEALAISGGGSRGAWGAGFLSGWRGNLPAQERPFDLVTGVSVGALLATHAYLGLYAQEEDGPQRLNEIFLELTNRQVRRRRVRFVWTLAADSTHSNARLAKTLRRVITEELLLRVNERQQQDPGLLCVTTVNLRSGGLVRWDLTRIATDFAAAQGESRAALLDLYRNLLLAATAIPGVFSPQEISFDSAQYTVENSVSGDRHIDSGVRNQVVGPAPPATQAEDLYDDEYGMLFGEMMENEAPPPKVYLLINADPVLPASQDIRVGPFPVLAVAARSLLIILNQSAKSSRERVQAQAREFNATCQAVAMRPTDLQPTTCKAYARSGARSNAPLEALEFNCSRELFGFGQARGRSVEWQACESL